MFTFKFDWIDVITSGISSRSLGTLPQPRAPRVVMAGKPYPIRTGIQKGSCVTKIEVDVEVKDHKTRSKNENPYNWLTAHCIQVNPYIGLKIYNDLKRGIHINNISKKANATLGLHRRNLRNVPETCRKVAYRYIFLVRSTTEDGATIRNPYMKGGITKVEKSISYIRRQLETETLEERRHSLRLILIYKVFEGLVPALAAWQLTILLFQQDEEENQSQNIR
ncbi:Hypothetical predicted protein [Mytilus galloprovincialis]|uniref:Uncharacterized protein n=1 Tax=Mytilus galloprovincialis TaxID=29158 RepID=A0A8B6EET5_MYTGA|nr:Hypothetical predicted protein [Mytilus galloprovincialis]